MDYSASNTAIWNGVIQIGLVALAILAANLLCRKIPFIRKSMMPTAVLGGFILLLVRQLDIIHVDLDFLNTLTYHGIAIGFIAMSLRIGDAKKGSGAAIGAKSGMLIVSTYLVQAITGLVISLGLAYTVMPGLFKASGILLPMGYGQGPGQANNVGSTYESLGFVGGRSFGLSIAACGYLCACIVGVIYINYLNKKGVLTKKSGSGVSGSVTVDTFQDDGELPIAESVDRFSIQAVLVVAVYLVTFLVTKYICAGLEAISPGLASTVSSILWGFNFIIGSLMAICLKSIFNLLRKKKIMTRQYQNNYLLSRISGVAFDVMIVGGIASIEIEKLSGLWLPFVLMVVAGGVVTLLYLRWACKKLYPDYFYEGLTSMYGMLTGTISSGVLLLRELDPEFETPAANNMVLGSSFGIAFGAPLLILIALAPESTAMTFIVFGLVVVYLAALLFFMLKKKRK